MMPWSSFSRTTELRSHRRPKKSSLAAVDFAHLDAVPILRDGHRPADRRNHAVELNEAVAFHAHEDVAVLFRESAVGPVPRPGFQNLERYVKVVAGPRSWPSQTEHGHNGVDDGARERQGLDAGGRSPDQRDDVGRAGRIIHDPRARVRLRVRGPEVN